MLEVEALSKAFVPGEPVVRQVSLTVAEGEIVVLLGPSGCGKTTLLRLVAGLEEPDAGSLRYAGRDLRAVPVHQRHFGFMFQDFALFPHRTVGENIGFGLRMANAAPKTIRARVESMLALVDLPGYDERSVYGLSGGERQRVALARSLAPNPRLVLLDEPLGSLDRALREELMNEVRAILKEVGVTALYVTHDQQEAYAVGDRLVVMNRGRVEQIGTPPQVYRRPANAFVARFLGQRNLLPVRPAADPGLVETFLGALPRPADKGTPSPEQAEFLLIRPRAAAFAQAGTEVPHDFRALVRRTTFRGDHYLLEVEPDVVDAALLPPEDESRRLHFEMPWPSPDMGQADGDPHWVEGQAVSLKVEPAQMLLL